MLSTMLIELAKVSEWLDQEVSEIYKNQALAQDWARISKIGEELGEAINEFILYTGQNPRKPQTDSINPLLEELADTALTAILCIQHFTDDVAQTGTLLVDSTAKVTRRMVQHKIAARKATAPLDPYVACDFEHILNHSGNTR